MECDGLAMCSFLYTVVFRRPSCYGVSYRSVFVYSVYKVGDGGKGRDRGMRSEEEGIEGRGGEGLQ